MTAPKKPTRRQHFVPRWYLKNFSEGGQLYAFDKPRGQSFRTSTANIGLENNFYTLPSDPPGDEPLAEHLLSVAEAECAQCVDRVLNRIGYYVHKFPDLQHAAASGYGHSILQTNDRAILAYFTMLQVARTPARRLGVEQAERELLAWAKDLFRHREDVDLTSLNPDSREGEAALQVDAIFSEELMEVAANIASWTFVFHYKRRGRPLYTSDTPVVQRDVSEVEDFECPAGLFGQSDRRKLSKLVYKSVFYVPLSSRVLLLILGGRRGGLVPNIHGRVLEMMDSDESCGAQVIYSRRQVYCARNDFDLARQLLDEYPESANPDRTFGRIAEPGEILAEARRRTERRES